MRKSYLKMTWDIYNNILNHIWYVTLLVIICKSYDVIVALWSGILVVFWGFLFRSLRDKLLWSILSWDIYEADVWRGHVPPIIRELEVLCHQKIVFFFDLSLIILVRYINTHTAKVKNKTSWWHRIITCTCTKGLMRYYLSLKKQTKKILNIFC